MTKSKAIISRIIKNKKTVEQSHGTGKQYNRANMAQKAEIPKVNLVKQQQQPVQSQPVQVQERLLIKGNKERFAYARKQRSKVMK